MSLLNLPSTVVRKASATIQSTLNSAASAAGGGRRASHRDHADVSDETILRDAKDKVTLQLKSSPSKDAKTTEHLSVRSGYLSKRNEQGQFQKRFVCLVPHTFLYYFESESSESPRGVIDISLYDTTSIEDSNTLKMSTYDDAILKPYYFQSEDINVLNDWQTSLRQDRFFVIKDERDNYKHIHEEFSGEIKSKEELVEESTLDLNRTNVELQEAKLESLESLNAIKRVLIRFGVSDDEMEKITTATKACDAINSRIDNIEAQHMSEVYAYEQKSLQYSLQMEEKVNIIEKQLESEKKMNASLEQEIAKLKATIEERNRDAIVEIEKATMNMQIAVNAKNVIESKASTLSEQKKLLVKEVKTLRTKLEDANETIEQLRGLNDRLGSAMLSIKENSTSETTSSHLFSFTSLATDLISRRGDTSPTNHSSKPEPLVGIPPVDTLVKVSDKTNTEPPDEVPGPLWESPRQETKDSGWLSFEQRDGTDKKSQSSEGSQGNSGSHIDTSIGTFFNPTSFLSSPSSGSSKDGRTRHSAGIMNLFQSGKSTTPMLDINDADVHSDYHTSETHSNDRTSERSRSPMPTEEEDRTPSAMRLHCLRCHGTVEGPKYSTCKCAIPALTPEDLNTGSSLVGLLSKGAGGIAGGFARRVSTVSGYIIQSGKETSTSGKDNNIPENE